MQGSATESSPVSRAVGLGGMVWVQTAGVNPGLISQDFWYRAIASLGVSMLMPMWGRVVL